MSRKFGSLYHKFGKGILHDIKVIVVLILITAFLSADVPLYQLSRDPANASPDVSVFNPSDEPAAKMFGGKRVYIEAVTDIVPVKSTADGVEPDSGYVVTCSRDMDEKQLSGYISVSPLVTYTVSRQEEKKYLLSFDEPLQPNSIVSFALNSSAKPRSWAFQTKQEFSVVHSFPADRSVNVPISTGIEVEMSHIDINNFEKCFKIEPETKGRFEKHGKTWVFVPQLLQRDTLYTVTISKDLLTGGGEKLGSDHVFTFRTEVFTSYDRSYLHIRGNAYETFMPDVTPVVEIGASEHFNDIDFKVKIYRYSDDKAYINALKDRHDYIQDQLGYETNYIAGTDGLELVSETTLKINRIAENEPWYPCYIVLPDKLPEGYYLVDINALNSKAGCGSHLQKYVQINPLAVYTLSVDGSQLVWVNDTASGMPVSGAEVNINGKTALTDENGLAQISTPDTEYGDFGSITVGAGSLPFVSQLNLEPGSRERPVNERFYTYIYTDRERYQPSDTVKIWGIVLSKDGKSVPPKEAELRFYLGYDDETPEVQKVNIGASGSFSGEISFTGLSATDYRIELAGGDTVYCSKYVNIGEYVKPSYVIEADLEKSIYFAWDTIPLSVKASFFDGTPAANTEFRVYESSTGIYTSADSGADGTFKHLLGYKDTDNSWYPHYCSYSVATAGAEDVQVDIYDWFYVVPRDVMVKASVKNANDKYSLSVSTNRIILDSITGTEDVYENDYEKLTGPAVDIPVKVSVIEVTYTKKQTGTYYDFINKVSSPKYEYTRSEKQIDSFSGTTSNGSIVFKDLPYSITDNRNYYAVIECDDTRGKPISEKVYFCREYYPSDSNVKRFSFNYDGEYDWPRKGFSLNETVAVRLEESRASLRDGLGMEPAGGSGRILCAVVQNGLMRYETFSELSFNYTFMKQDIPNIQLIGAYFDGRNIYPVDSAYLFYNPSEMELSVKTVPDKERYSPGEKAELDVTVADRNGSPVPGAAVCISVVDEAAFAVANQTADPLKEMYSRYFYTACSVFSSYTQHDFSGYPEAEGGGEGGSSGIRKNFLDTALFVSDVTDENGRAHISFKLPDNLTSWRVTTLSASDGVYAGNSKINIVTTLPMFTDLMVSRIFIKGDDLSASARAFGTALGLSDKVEFAAVLTSPDGTKKTLSGTGTAGNYINFNFGSGSEGVYTLTVTAKSKSGSDGIEKTFRVVNSAVEIPVTKTFPLAGGIDINALRSPVTLMFFDPSRELYNRCLMQLSSNYGRRADIRISRAVAQKKLQEIFGDNMPCYFFETQPDSIEPGSLQDYTGGVRLLDYSEAETELTAKLCAAAPEFLNTEAAAAYLSRVIKNEKSLSEDVAAAYMGLAALREPVLLDIRYMLSSGGSLGLKEKLYLTAGLAFAGDLATATEYFDEIAAPLLKTDYCGVYVSDANKDLSFEYTALAALTAIQAGKAPADGMLKYILKNPSNEVTACMECLFYILQKPRQTVESASFSYLSEGKTKTVTLGDRPFVLSMTADEVEKAGFRQASGNVSVFASYIGNAGEITDKASENVTLEKKIESADNKPIAQSSLIKITITPKFGDAAPKGWYELSDCIPSGARYAYCLSSNWNRNWWLESVEGQKITFSVKNPESGDIGMVVAPITFYVRAALTGRFVADSAYIKSAETAAWGMSEKNEIQITE